MAEKGRKDFCMECRKEREYLLQKEDIIKTIRDKDYIFGMYGGKVLERITHNETPWNEAGKGYGDGIPSNELLPKERIMRYYEIL